MYKKILVDFYKKTKKGYLEFYWVYVVITLGIALRYYLGIVFILSIPFAFFVFYYIGLLHGRISSKRKR
jgi:hypothetical protein